MTQAPAASASRQGTAEEVGSNAQLHDAALTGAPAPVQPEFRPGMGLPPDGNNLVGRLMSTAIRKLAWSRLANPKVAMAVSGCGLLFGAIVGAFAPNTSTLQIQLPLSHFPHWLEHNDILTVMILYAGDILACLGLAGMLWAHAQGWRPDPRKLFLASAGVVAVLVCLTPVGSSDTASYAAFGRIASLGGNPYTQSPAAFLPHSAYLHVVGTAWTHQVSVYGPIATWVQQFAASIGGSSVATTIWVLMILNGAAFIGVGWLLLKTSDDPTRATLFWVANPVLIQQLVAGGHLDTFVAGACICAIQVARRVSGIWGDILIGVLIGLACGVKISAVLVAVGLAWPMLRRHEWLRIARITAVSLVTVGALYSGYGISALKPLLVGSKWVILPSPWRPFQAIMHDLLGVHLSTISLVITVIWPIAMIIVAWIIYHRISSDQPQEVIAPFALSFAWILVAPWVFPWYAALAWVALTQVPRNRMTRWLAIVTVILALWHSGGGHGPPAGRL